MSGLPVRHASNVNVVFQFVIIRGRPREGGIVTVTELHWRDYYLKHDREATIEAYAKLAATKASRCHCGLCRNFVAQISEFLTEDLKGVFSTLGVNPEYADQYDIGKDPYTGRYRYGGWYHFFGEIVGGGGIRDLDGFRFEFGTAFPDPPKPFRAEPNLVAIDFEVALPWGISEAEPKSPLERQVAHSPIQPPPELRK
jgi:hypothetical protein